MNYSRGTYFFLLLLCVCTTHSFIYELSVLRRWDGKAGKYYYFIGLSDFHEKGNKYNESQVQQMRSVLKSCNKHDLKIGSEDVSAPGENPHARCGRFVIRSRGGVLAGFGRCCKELNLDITNLEYRYCRVTALGPVVNNLEKDPKKIPSVLGIQVHAIVKEIEDLFQEVYLYNDGSLLNKFYRVCIDSIKKSMHRLQLYTHTNITVADYLDLMSTKWTRERMLNDLLTFDSVLLDLRFLHDIIQNKEKTVYLAVAGGSHIKRITQFLEKFDWQPVYKTNTTFVKEQSRINCLGSNTGSVCQKPNPIDMRIIKNYL